MMRTPPARIDLENGIHLEASRPEFADAVFALVDRNRGHLSQWMTWVDAVLTPADLRSYFLVSTEYFARHERYHYTIFLEGVPIGSIDLHGVDWAGSSTYIGYWLGEEVQGRGIMTRCAEAMTNLAVRGLGINRVAIRVAPGNLRSRAIPRRLGYAFEALLREAQPLHGTFIDLEQYVMLARTWAER
jgi:ribosomal-protein-serine acetyltransferase